MKIAVVGEFLGEEKEASTELLNDLLSLAGLATIQPCKCHGSLTCWERTTDRSSLFLTHVFNQRPKNNVISTFFVKKAEAKKLGIVSKYGTYGSVGVLRPERDAELERLQKEMDRENPTIIVALGPVALWVLTGLDKIANYRGVVLPSTLVPQTKVLATFHPQAVLKDYSFRPVVIADLLKAKAEAEFKEIRRKSRSIWLAEKYEDLLTFEKIHLSGATHFSVDVETAAQQITHIAIAPSEKVGIVCELWNKKTGESNYSEAEELRIRRWFARILGDRRTVKIGQNFYYDLTYFADAGIFVRGRIEDTMLQAHSDQIEMPKDLGFLGSIHANEAPWKSMRVTPVAKRHKKDE